MEVMCGVLARGKAEVCTCGGAQDRSASCSAPAAFEGHAFRRATSPHFSHISNKTNAVLSSLSRIALISFQSTPCQKSSTALNMDFNFPFLGTFSDTRAPGFSLAETPQDFTGVVTSDDTFGLAFHQLTGRML